MIKSYINNVEGISSKEMHYYIDNYNNCITITIYDNDFLNAHIYNEYNNIFEDIKKNNSYLILDYKCHVDIYDDKGAHSLDVHKLCIINMNTISFIGYLSNYIKSY